MTKTITPPTGPDDDDQRRTPATPVAHALAESIDTVRQLLAAGILDAAALGLAPSETRGVVGPAGVLSAARDASADRTDDAARQGTLPTWFLVPGEPIKVRDLMEKTRSGLKPETRRAYGSYLDFLANGWSSSANGAPPLQRYPSLGDRWAHEVLPSDLEQALRFVEQRAQEAAARRAEIRESVGRTPIVGTGVGAQYNAVGAWRRAFEVAVKDRHLAKQFNPAKDVKKPRRR